MKRMIGILAMSSALAGCGSTNFNMPSFDLFKAPAPTVVSVHVESQPPGAEAKAPTGAACRTPCSLGVAPIGTSSIIFTLPNYLPTSVPVTVRTVRETWDNAESGAVGDQVTIDPNPVYAILEPAPPPPPPRRAPVAKPKPKPRPQQPAAVAPPPPQQQPQPQPFGPPPPPPPGGFR